MNWAIVAYLHALCSYSVADPNHSDPNSTFHFDTVPDPESTMIKSASSVTAYRYMTGAVLASYFRRA